MKDLILRGVSKRYRLQDATASGRGLARRLVNRLLQPRHDFWALRDVSLEVDRGETLGVIGHNGAGKSTLLKLLSRITAPSEGEIRIRGRLSALIELGSGFHPELTGRENLFLSGAILGMRRREIAAKLQSIVEFAGVHEFIDVPVKWYSSGMYVRLGFAMAAHLDPDILLVDEVLSVGDASFQGRCFNRISELKRVGTTIVLISHDLGSVERLADRAILLDHGRLVASGRPADVIWQYQHGIDERVAADRPAAPSKVGSVRIHALALRDEEGRDTATVRTGDPLHVGVRVSVPAAAETPIVDLFFYSFEDGVLHAQCSTETSRLPAALEGACELEFCVPALGLQPVVYTVDAMVREEGEWQPDVRTRGRSTLYVTEGRGVDGRFFMPHSVRLIEPTGPSTVDPRDTGQARIVEGR